MDQRYRILDAFTMNSAWKKLSQAFGNKKDLRLTVLTNLKKLSLKHLPWFERVEQLAAALAKAKAHLVDQGGLMALEGDDTIIATLMNKLDVRQQMDWDIHCARVLGGDDTSLCKLMPWLEEQQ